MRNLNIAYIGCSFGFRVYNDVFPISDHLSKICLCILKELFKRAENREQLKKRFEIQKKLRIQQKLKGDLTPKKRKSISDDDEAGAASHEVEKDKGMYL